MALSLFGATVAPANAQQCQPSPRCTQAQQNVEASIARIDSGQVANISTAAEKGYCATTLAAAALDQCASDFRATGNSACADAVQAQADSYRQTAAQFRSTFRDVTTSNGGIACK